MKSLKLAVLLAALPLAVAAQDPVKVDAGHYKVVLDNPSVRVLKVAVPAGDKSPMHSHPDAILVPLASAKARFTLPDGKTQDMEVVKETAAWTPGGHALASQRGHHRGGRHLGRVQGRPGHCHAAGRAPGHPDDYARREPARRRHEDDCRR